MKKSVPTAVCSRSVPIYSPLEDAGKEGWCLPRSLLHHQHVARDSSEDLLCSCSKALGNAEVGVGTPPRQQTGGRVDSPPHCHPLLYFVRPGMLPVPWCCVLTVRTADARQHSAHSNLPWQPVPGSLQGFRRMVFAAVCMVRYFQRRPEAAMKVCSDTLSHVSKS